MCYFKSYDHIGFAYVFRLDFIQCSELRTMSVPTLATDHVFVWSRPSSKRHVHVHMVH